MITMLNNFKFAVDFGFKNYLLVYLLGDNFQYSDLKNAVQLWNFYFL